MGKYKHYSMSSLQQEKKYLDGRLYEMYKNGDPAGKINNVLVKLDWVNHYIRQKEEHIAAMTPNPKQLYGDKKPALGVLPLIGQIAQWSAHQDGANKYGPYNWRDDPVEAMTYIHACIRHLELFLNGEEFARDTGVSNLGAVMACCAILLDAQAHGTMIDNRRVSWQACDALHNAETTVAKLRAMQESRDNKDG